MIDGQGCSSVVEHVQSLRFHLQFQFVSHCSDKNTDQTNLWHGKSYLACRFQAIIDGIQGRTLRQEPGVKEQKQI